jgi:hypothetical protein
MSLVVAVDAVRRVCEPDRSIGSHHDIVRTVERLALEVVGDDADRSVVLGTADASGAMLARDHSALSVKRVAVREPRGLAVHADIARGLVPPQHAIVGDVAPHQVPAGRKVDRPFRPSAVAVQALDACVAATVCEAIVEDFESRWSCLCHDRIISRSADRPGGRIGKAAGQSRVVPRLASEREIPLFPFRAEFKP